MNFETLDVRDAVLIRSDIHRDERGSFSRLRCAKEFAEHGLPAEFVQTNLSTTQSKGALRGMHFQIRPSLEGKLVRCLNGRIYDVIIDLRPNSASYLQHFGVELTAGDGLALFVPWGCAHGFETLQADCHVLYEMADYYEPELSRGVRWNDPAFAIQWPVQDPSGNERDMNYPDFDPDLMIGFGEPA